MQQLLFTTFLCYEKKICTFFFYYENQSYAFIFVFITYHAKPLGTPM